jgi:hypothetical protein
MDGADQRDELMLRELLAQERQHALECGAAQSFALA